MSRNRRISATSFPPVAVAAFRKELVAYHEKTALDFYRAEQAGVAAQLLAGLAPDAATMMQREAQSAREAELYWVSTDIAHQALDASTDIPHISPLDIPADSGIIFFEKPLAPLPMDKTARGVYLTQAKLVAEKLGGTHALKNLTSEVYGVMWAHLGRNMLALHAFGLHGAKPAIPGDVDPRLPLAYFDLPLGQVTEIGELTQSEGQQAFLAFISALWVLMKTPTVAQLSEGDIATGVATPRRTQVAEEPPAPFTVPDKRRVQVVDMVPMRHVPDTTEEQEGDEGKRQYRRSAYKWVVRGHWRNQRVGKGREERRLTWIASHLRGNPDGPLKTSEKVYTWRTRTTSKEES